MSRERCGTADFPWVFTPGTKGSSRSNVFKSISEARTKTKIRIGRTSGELGTTMQYVWRDKRDFFDTSTSHLRQLQSKPPILHSAILKWQGRTNWTPNMRQLWRETWWPYRSQKENAFLWQIIYQIPATQKWQHPTLTSLDVATHYTRCTMHEQEDIVLCVWTCPQAVPV
jgi:hypothetical protein